MSTIANSILLKLVSYHFDCMLACFFLISMPKVISGEKGNAIRFRGAAAIPEPFITNGCTRFHGLNSQ